MAFSQEHKHQLSKPLTIFQLLHKSLTLSITNLSRLLPSLLLSVLSTTSLLLVFFLLLQPLLTSITAKAAAIASLDPSSPARLPLIFSLLQDLKKLAIIQPLYLLLSFVLASLVSILTIRALVLSKQHASSPSSLKGPMITQLYIWLFHLTLNSVFLSLGAFLLFRHHSMLTMKLLVVVSAYVVLALGWYLGLSVLLSVAVVVSVVGDEDRCGMRAIAKAWGVVKGRRWQAVKLAAAELVIAVLAYGVLKYIAVVVIKNSSATSSLVVRVGASAAVSVVMVVFRWAVAAVYYKDCRRSDEGIMELEEVEEGGGFMYYVRLPMVARTLC